LRMLSGARPDHVRLRSPSCFINWQRKLRNGLRSLLFRDPATSARRKLCAWYAKLLFDEFSMSRTSGTPNAEFDIVASWIAELFLRPDEQGSMSTACREVLEGKFPATPSGGVIPRGRSYPTPLTSKVPPDADEAMGALKAKANELREADPTLSAQQAFARVYADPANRKLAEAERRQNRPA
jgi:hypothetical protein